MVQAPVKPITLEGFLQLPETKPASEYIDGQIIQKPMPKAAHSTIQGELVSAVNAKVKPNKIGRAFPELRCTFGGRSVIPDVSVLSWVGIPRDEEGKISGELLAAPDWIIEILSPGQSQTKVAKKILHSLEHGTQLGWLIDPDEECVFVYTPDLKAVLCEKKEVVLPVPPFAESGHLTLAELVSWLYE